MKSQAINISIVVLILTTPVWGQRSKIDTITLRNGDTITGEIKSLDRGLLKVKTDFMGTVNIEWRGVLRVESTQFFEVETSQGQRLFGTLPDPAQDSIVMVGAPGLAEPIDRVEVVRIVPLNQGFWERLTGYVDVGYSFARANRNATFTLGSEASIQSEKNSFVVEYNSQLTSSQDRAKQTRNATALTFNRSFEDRWFGVAVAQFSQNDELDLRFRQLYGGGVGRFVVQTNRTLLAWWGGAGWTTENFSTEDEARSNVEGIATLSHSYFIFEGNTTDLNTALVFFPNLSDFGRIRIELQNRIQWEIFKDFTWNVTFRNSYDSRPPTAGTEKNDFTLTTSVGFKF